MPSDATKTLKLFTVLGVVALVLFIAIPGILGFIVLQKLKLKSFQAVSDAVSTSTVPTNSAIGELGSACGGTDRLPCRPGLKCSVEPTSQTTGVCEKAEIGIVTPTVGQEGEACGADRACDALLYCKHSPGQMSGVCVKRDSGAPYVSSFKLDGLQFQDGVYAGRPGDAVQAEVVAANAESAKLVFMTNTGERKEVGELKKGTGGQYAVTFSVTPGMDGLLRAVVTAKNGDTADLAVHIATIQ